MRLNLSTTQRRILRALWCFLAVLVAVISLVPAAAAPIRWIDQAGLSDKALHAAGYLPLAFLPALHERRRRVALLVAVSMLLGVALEYAQSLVDGRSFEAGDMVANGAGLLAGLLAGLPFRSGPPPERPLRPPMLRLF